MTTDVSDRHMNSLSVVRPFMPSFQTMSWSPSSKSCSEISPKIWSRIMSQMVLPTVSPISFQHIQNLTALHLQKRPGLTCCPLRSVIPSNFYRRYDNMQQDHSLHPSSSQMERQQILMQMNFCRLRMNSLDIISQSILWVLYHWTKKILAH